MHGFPRQPGDDIAGVHRVGGEAQQAAAGLALGHCSAEAHALLFDELQGLADEYASDRTKARHPTAAVAIRLGKQNDPRYLL